MKRNYYGKKFCLWCLLHVRTIIEPLRFEVKEAPEKDFYELDDLYRYWFRNIKSTDK